ncbi:PriCT-2 domain-containing protein [Ralstonia pseudosolanacearum]|uniref:PriCT-2 domain-containing protein n=1 Tax=Ralstonia pseudosolanacearum TaxID=1310165 RepID=UPI003CE909CA
MTAIDIDRARAALWALDAGVNRREWVRVGCAAKAAGLGFEDFHDWSSTAGNYGGQGDTRDAWKSFKQDGGVNAGTLFHLARQTGWADPANNNKPQRDAKRAAPLREWWDRGQPATADHGYIARKHGAPDGLRLVSWPLQGWAAFKGRSLEGWLMVPVRTPSGELASIQFIGSNGGEKLNAYGCPMTGTFTVGTLDHGAPAYIAEGIGHAWSLHAITSRAAVVSFGAANIERAAATIKAAGAVPVIVADRGKESEARDAAMRQGCEYVTLPADMANGADVNDLHLERGADAVREAVARATRAVQATPVPANENAPLPTIEIKNGERARVVADLAHAMAAGAPYYRRDAMLVRAVTLPADEETGGVFRSRGSVLLRQAKPSAVIADASRFANVVKFDGRARKMVPCDLPDAVAQSFCELGIEQECIPSVIGVVRCPIMHADGSLHTAGGYDPRKKLILAGNEDWSALSVPDRPTQDDAQAALHWLLETAYRDFPFADDASKSVAVSSLLTAVIRPAIDCAPVHAFSAPQYGAGKSLQASFASIVATGTKPGMIAPGHDQQEFEKRVDAAIIAGDPVVILDNLSRPLSGDNLCSAITSDTATVRPLGSSTQMRVRTSAFWMATGQNLAVKRDMHRRTVIGYIDARMERPETRSGFAISDLLGWAAENRMRILSAVYTMLRAHALAGYPSNGEKSLGNFEAWSSRVAHCLVWLGMVNPVRSQERLREDDPDVQNRMTLMRALMDWQEACLNYAQSWNRGWTFSDLRAACNAVRADERDLMEAIGAAVHKGIDGMPWWLRKHKNVTIECEGISYRLQTCGNRSGGVDRWEVVALGDDATVSADERPF